MKRILMITTLLVTAHTQITCQDAAALMQQGANIASLGFLQGQYAALAHDPINNEAEIRGIIEKAQALPNGKEWAAATSRAFDIKQTAAQAAYEHVQSQEQIVEPAAVCVGCGDGDSNFLGTSRDSDFMNPRNDTRRNRHREMRGLFNDPFISPAQQIRFEDLLDGREGDF